MDFYLVICEVAEKTHNLIGKTRLKSGKMEYFIIYTVGFAIPDNFARKYFIGYS